MSEYWSVKLNVPIDKEEAIRTLVPPGEPVSGALIAVLLGVARDRGAVVDGTFGSDAAWQRRLDRLNKRVDRVEARLDVIARG